MLKSLPVKISLIFIINEVQTGFARTGLRSFLPVANLKSLLAP
jgi:4-aminobutyrate aminotransferase-like enzyme